MIRSFYTVFGLLSVSFGMIGVFVPVWPTTPFVLLAVWLFSRADNKHEQRILNHRIIGPYVRNYVEHRGMTSSAKWKSILFLWTGLIISMLLQSNPVVMYVLLVIGLAVSVHILLLQTVE